MDTVSLPKIVLSPKFRAARRYYFNNEDVTPMLISPRSLERISHSPSLDNPLVLAAIVAGLLGVAIIAVILIGVWIRTKLMKSSPFQRNSRNNSCRESNITASMSTLDDFGNETQLSIMKLDDLTIVNEEAESVTIENGEANNLKIDIFETQPEPASSLPRIDNF